MFTVTAKRVLGALWKTSTLDFFQKNNTDKSMFKIKRVDIDVYGDEKGLYLKPCSADGEQWILRNMPNGENGISLQDILLITDMARAAGLTVCIMRNGK
jgi:hypothetical protein